MICSLGLKKTMGCSHAIFVLQQCTEYFLQHGSNVYMAALDATKAFDRVNHIKLFHRMYNIGVPIHVIKLVMNWYAKIVSVVRWENCYSAPFIMRSGVRQGGVLSPICLISMWTPSSSCYKLVIWDVTFMHNMMIINDIYVNTML